MTKEDDYRRNAAETVELANHAVTSADKGRLLRLAENGSTLPTAPPGSPGASVPSGTLNSAPTIRWCAERSITSTPTDHGRLFGFPCVVAGLVPAINVFDPASRKACYRKVPV